MKKTQGFLALVVCGLFSMNAAAEEATVIKDYGCGLFSGDSGLSVSLFTNEKTQAVVTPSGNTKLTCHFQIPEGFEPNQAIVNTGFPCGTFLGVTTDSKSVVTPGGQATLTCQIKH